MIQTLSEAGQIVNHDESNGKPFHDDLHDDMMLALKVGQESTLTDFHQHWVDKAGTTLDLMKLNKILKWWGDKGLFPKGAIKPILEKIVGAT